MKYPYRKTRDDNGTFLITFPDFPEAATFAETEDEIETRARDAIETAIMARIADRKPIPLPRPKARGRNGTVTLDAGTAIKIGLWNTMREKDITKAELGRRTKWHRPQIDRVLSIRHASNLAQLERAAEAIGATIEAAVRT